MRKLAKLLLLALVFCFALFACHGYLKAPSLPESDQLGLESTLSTKSKLQQILDYQELYPERLIESVKRNPEIVDFALAYPEKKGTYKENIDLSSKYKEGEIPLLMQWDEDWGYAPYGQGLIGLDGCGPTALSMVYIGLTGDLSYNPQVVAKFSEDNGYLDKKNDITLWTLMSEGARKLGLQSKELPLDEKIMARELSKGHPIICSMKPGDFTTTGHFIVLYDYEDGDFFVKDPNSISRSHKRWNYSVIESQINNIWAFWK